MVVADKEAGQHHIDLQREEADNLKGLQPFVIWFDHNFLKLPIKTILFLVLFFAALVTLLTIALKYIFIFLRIAIKDCRTISIIKIDTGVELL